MSHEAEIVCSSRKSPISRPRGEKEIPISKPDLASARGKGNSYQSLDLIEEMNAIRGGSIEVSLRKLRPVFILLLSSSLLGYVHAGFDFELIGEVHSVDSTQNKIIMIVSGECRFVNAKGDGWMHSFMDHGLVIIGRKDLPHSPDQNLWEALIGRARKSIGRKKTTITCIDPDSISIERAEVFMVRCRLMSYPEDKQISTTVDIR